MQEMNHTSKYTISQQFNMITNKHSPSGTETLYASASNTLSLAMRNAQTFFLGQLCNSK